MGLRLADLMTGGAQVAVPLLLEQHKANIMSKRDEALAKVRKTETIEGREFKTAERISGQEATTARDASKQKAEAAEGVLERESKEKIAGLRDDSRPRDRFISSKDGLYDVIKREWVEVPEDETDLIKMAGRMAADRQKAEAADIMLEEKTDYETLLDESLAKLRSYKAKPKPTAPPPEVEPVKTAPSPGLGTGLPAGVSEESIALTMKIHGMTRQQVLDRLGKR